MPVAPERYNAYMNDYMKNRWQKRRAAAVESLGGSCVRCGSTEGLEFDHIDPETKLATIAKASSWSEVRFWDEVAKCQLLCTEHHLDKSRENGDFMKGRLRTSSQTG